MLNTKKVSKIHTKFARPNSYGIVSKFLFLEDFKDFCHVFVLKDMNDNIEQNTY